MAQLRLNSAPALLQGRMDEIIEELQGVKVYMDDLLIIGQGDSEQ